MKYFESNGLWFPAGQPSSAIGGTLSYSRDGLRLRLIGKFREGWSPQVDRYPVIHGVLVENPYGKFATLYDGLTSRLNLGWGGIASETILFSTAMIGDDHLPSTPTQFQSVDFTITYLNNWYDRTGLTVDLQSHDGDYQFVLRYRRPEIGRFSIGDDKVLTLGHSVSTFQGRHRASISEEAHVVIQPLHEVTPEQVVINYVQPIQNLLTFAANTANEAEEIQFRQPLVQGDEPGKAYNWIHVPAFRIEDERNHHRENEMLFSFAESQEDGLNIFQKWLDFSAKHAVFCTVYFGFIYAERGFPEDRFFRLMSAFTLLVSSNSEVSERTKQFLEAVNSALITKIPQETSRFLDQILPTGPEIELPHHLLRILRENESLMKQVIKGDFEDFVAAVINTLAYVKRRVAVMDRPILQGPDLYYAMQRIRQLIKIWILKKLGFSESRVSSFIIRQNEFAALRAV
jgi:hypothetical protein